MGRRRYVTVAAPLAVLLVAGCAGDEDPVTVTTTDESGETVVVTPSTEGPSGSSDLPAGAPSDPVATTLPVPTDADGVTTSASPTGTPGDTGTGTGAPPEQTVLSEVTLEVPGGWTVADMGEPEAATPAPGEVPPHLWCLAPPEELPEIDGCAGVVVAIGGDWLPGAAGQPYAPDQIEGWRWGTEPLACPFDPEADLSEDDPNIVMTDAEGAPLTSSETEVGGLLMRYETWRARCTGTEDAMTPQVWHVDELNLLVKDYYGLPQTFQMLESLEAA